MSLLSCHSKVYPSWTSKDIDEFLEAKVYLTSDEITSLSQDVVHIFSSADFGFEFISRYSDQISIFRLYH